MVQVTRRQEKKHRSALKTLSRLSKFAQVVYEQGNLCFFCGEEMQGDCTKEHLLAKARVKELDLDFDVEQRTNIRAAHGDCNSAAGHLPVSDKLRMREVGLAEGRHEMLRFARQLRRADARIAFSPPPKPVEPRYDVNVVEAARAPLGLFEETKVKPVKRSTAKTEKPAQEMPESLKRLRRHFPTATMARFYPTHEYNDSAPDPKSYGKD